MEKDVDVIIIGSGNGGSIPAARLSEAGFKVLVLERGKRFKENQYKQSSNPSYLKEILDLVITSPNITFRTGNSLGGASINMDGAHYRIPKKSFQVKDKNGRYHWPESINYNELLPYYKKAEEMLTNMINDPISYLKVLDSNPLFQSNVAKEMDEAQQVGDKKSFLDFKKSAEFKHIITAIKSGALPLFIQDLEGYNDFTDNELLEAFSDSFTESEKKDLDIRSKINNIIEKAKNLEHYYNYIEERNPLIAKEFVSRFDYDL